MDDDILTENDVKLWREYTRRIIAEGDSSSSISNTSSIVKLFDYPITPKNFLEQPKAKRRQNKYDAKLDLHGMTRNEAHKALETFLCVQKMRGSKCVLVITGKGHGKGEGLGILKRKVPLWLEISKMVSSWSIATLRDGGDGALYVKIK